MATTFGSYATAPSMSASRSFAATGAVGAEDTVDLLAIKSWKSDRGKSREADSAPAAVSGARPGEPTDQSATLHGESSPTAQHCCSGYRGLVFHRSGGTKGTACTDHLGMQRFRQESTHLK